MLHGNIHCLPDVSQICGLHAGILGQLLCQLFRALIGCFHVHDSGDGIAPRKLAACRFPAQFGQFSVQCSGLIRFHLVLYIGPGGCPGIRTIDTVCPVHHGVNGIGVEHQRDGAILGVTFLSFHHRNRRRGHPAQLQRFLQVFGGQVVHGHKVFVLIHLHRSTQLEPHRFLHRFAVSLAFGIFLCYTVFSRKARAFTALLGFEYRVSAFLINRTLRPSAPRIFGFHVGFAGGFRKTSLQTTP